MEDMNATPMAGRFTIGLFGRRNAGKSSLINALTGQEIAVTSDVPGTTTDPVYKTMELLPLGPVVFIDTAGLDDTGELGRLRVEKTREVLRKCQLALVVCDARAGFGAEESAFLEELRARKISFVGVLNQCDRVLDAGSGVPALQKRWSAPFVCTSAATGEGVEELKKQIIAAAAGEETDPSLTAGLVNAGEVAVLVTPIDKAAPKGRLILPQQQTIRDLLENDAVAVVTKEQELRLTLERLREPPAAVITDSQAFLKVAADTPVSVPMTSFSILFARQKADLAGMVRGIRRLERLKPGEKVLIMEGCTHHRQADDIGKVKIPRWVRQMAGGAVEFAWASGTQFPRDLEKYAAVIHCGGCMFNRREMAYRQETAHKLGVAMTNYGMLIAYVHGILPRALAPFPAARLALDEQAAR